MRKILVMLFALVMSTNLFAFEFDGINLNDEVLKVTRQVAKRGYVTDPERNCFKGMCQGQEIYLSFDFEHVSAANHIGALILDVPMKHSEAYETCVELCNVIYHQSARLENGIRYGVDEDGTTMLLSKTDEGIRLTYFTSYYREKKAKK